MGITEEKQSSGNQYTTPTNHKEHKRSLARIKFLEAAESCFAEYGYDGAKIRTIAEKAKVNLGTLQHYWGSKEQLFIEVCEIRIGAMNNHRMKLFDELDAAKGESMEIEDVIYAAVYPLFFPENANKKEQNLFRKFYGRMVTEPSPVAVGILLNLFTDVTDRFLKLLKNTCPHLNDDEFYWRCTCVIGSFLYSPVYPERLARYAHPEFNPFDTQLSIDQVVKFLSAGMRA